ncbi:MAG TPA: hypothetical protein VEY70_24110 [Metabacillus sp.]|nr:hypothetical protein [Metabacillus sp.]
MYKVIKSFRDSEDSMHTYRIGESFPREGFEPSDKRLEDLSSKNNKVGKALILKVSEPLVSSEENKYPYHIGGGYYKLSNGEKVKGKANANKEEMKLKVGDKR